MIYKIIPTVEKTITSTTLEERFNKEKGTIESTEFSLDDSFVPLLDSKICLKSFLESREFGKNLNGILPSFEIKLKEVKEDELLVSSSELFIFMLDVKDENIAKIGLNDDYDLSVIKDAIDSRLIGEYLNSIEVKRGDYFSIDKGTIYSFPLNSIYYEVSLNPSYPVLLDDADVDSLDTKKYQNRSNRLKTKSSYKAIFVRDNIEVLRLYVKEKFTLRVKDSSFYHVLVIKGKPNMGGEAAQPFDSFYIDPDSKIEVEGEADLLIVRCPKYFMGLDVGGTSIKGMIIDDIGLKITENKTVMTTAEEITANLKLAIDGLAEQSNLPISLFKKLGVGFPGNINTKEGEVVFSNNLDLHHYKLKEELENLYDFEVIVDNDANCAALGEYKFTDKKKYHDMVLITLGTGFGSGIIIDSKLFKGGQGSVTELGHMKIKTDRVMCTCGQYGCVEALTSLARIKMEVEKLRENEATGINALLDEKESPLKLFTLKTDNEYVNDFVRKYLNNLLLALVNIANILQPQVIAIGGGVSYSIKEYIPSLEKRLNRMKYSSFEAPYIKLVQAELGNEAGSFGACALTFDE